MTLRSIPVLLLVVAACAGGIANPTANRTPEAVVQSFLAAARAGNDTLMATFWGGPKGPAAKTKQPSDYEKRIEIMRKYLANDSTVVVGRGNVVSQPQQVMVTVRIYRGKCQNLVPFIAGPWKDVWLIQNVDVTNAGNPARPCDDQGNPL